MKTIGKRETVAGSSWWSIRETQEDTRGKEHRAGTAAGKERGKNERTYVRMGKKKRRGLISC